MALEKTRTPGIRKFIGKKGKVKYRLLINVQVPDPLSPTGYRWKLKVETFAKEQEAINAKVKTQAEIKSGKYVEPSDLSVKELVEKWLEAGKTRGVSKQGPWKIQTYLAHKTQLERYIAPELGELKASKLKKAAIEQAAAVWGRSVDNTTVNKVLFDALGAAYKFALKDPDSFGIRQNPLGQVERFASRITLEELEARALGEIADIGEDRPETKRGALREIQPDEVYSALELKSIIESAMPGLEKALLMTAIFTGPRHGELCGLRWPMIDLKKGILTVNRSLTQLPKNQGGPILERPKTSNAYRRLGLAPELRRELTAWKIACPPNPNGFVFVDPMGRPQSRKQNNDALRSACERAGVRALSMNNLRHSFASQQLMAGATPLEVSYLMGHSSPAVTLAIYARWAKTEKSDSQNRLASRIMQATEEAESKRYNKRIT
jgi:integrase